MKITTILTLCLSFMLSAGLQANSQADPLNSVMWDYNRQIFLGNNAEYVFDDRIKVGVPQFAEDPTQVPVDIDATALTGEIVRIVSWADMNPIQHIFTYYPHPDVLPKVSMRIKVQQATPVRAAVLTKDGVWHIGSSWLEAAGGGCTTPSVGNADPYWESHLGETKSRVFKGAQSSRYKFRVIHPMDTGLVGSIPEFFIQQVELRDKSGRALARMELSPPVSENPVITFDLRTTDAKHHLWLRDNNGNEFEKAL
ncbi:quinoprotein dehydrogenase-associated SoxYZ-like carrier [Pontibacterium sp.]|uniref:quinoprotein dehydrogenase-associated SoxYZ-like carrier n=1 Tax=Pontibacterium sp. TaxID=2036026 RepID=UPI003515BAB7